MASQQDLNRLQALIRKLTDKSEAAEREARQATRHAARVEGVLNGVQKSIQKSAIQPLTNRERALAACKDMRPGYIVLEIGFLTGATAKDSTEQRSDTVGRFIVDRIRASFRNSSGQYGYISSAQNPDLTSTNVVDFTWELIDGRNNQHLSDRPLPSDILAKNDGDGFPAGGWVLEPGTDVNLEITPLRAIPGAADETNYITIVLEGIQCYDQVGAP
jgi:hypothetical protein